MALHQNHPSARRADSAANDRLTIIPASAPVEHAREEAARSGAAWLAVERDGVFVGVIDAANLDGTFDNAGIRVSALTERGPAVRWIS